MRLQIASDLHHEFIAPGQPGSEPIALADGVDVLVLAGDIHSHANACNLYRDYPVAVY
jgi:predicted phosphodiesterase